MKKVNILHLYPKEMDLYGDGGNVRCLIKRLQWRGIPVTLTAAGVGERLPESDIIFIGGGQDREMEIVAPDVKKKSAALSYAIQSGTVVLAICGGFQLLGAYYQKPNGTVLPLADCLPFYTVAGEERMIGNTVFATPFGKAVGFENHSGKTYLGALSPLGKVITGYGNNGEDGGEGLLFNNTFCTYAHGPLLPKNPAVADELLRRALKTQSLPPLDDTLENRCHNTLLAKFS